MLSKPAANSWWESNSASLHQTQGASFPLGGEVLLESRDARVADMHVPIVAVTLPSPPTSPYGSCVHDDPSQEVVED